MPIAILSSPDFMPLGSNENAEEQHQSILLGFLLI